MSNRALQLGAAVGEVYVMGFEGEEPGEEPMQDVRYVEEVNKMSTQVFEAIATIYRVSAEDKKKALRDQDVKRVKLL